MLCSEEQYFFKLPFFLSSSFIYFTDGEDLGEDEPERCLGSFLVSMSTFNGCLCSLTISIYVILLFFVECSCLLLACFYFFVVLLGDMYRVTAADCY